LLLAIPMCVLYEVGIVVARLVGKAAPAADPADLSEADAGEAGRKDSA
jgi:Sec-independent protein secretion pathway component TatC